SDGDFADHRAKNRKIELHLIEQFPSELRFNGHSEGDNQHEEDGKTGYDVIRDHAADSQHELGKRRQRFAFQHVLKDQLELGHNEYHQDDQNCGGHEHDGGGIKHRGNDFAFDFLRLFHELGKAV